MIHFKLDATDSTNSYLKELLSSTNLSNWTVVSTKQQVRGRGQQGSEWFSDIDKNLTFSILIKHTRLKAMDQFLLNCAVSQGIFKVMRVHNIPRLKVKWPNDIMSGSTKLAGILIENSLVNDTISNSIVGIGLNVNQREFPTDLPGAVSMSQCTGINYDLDTLLQELVESIRAEIALIEKGQHEVLRSGYADKMYRRDAPHMFRIPGGKPFLAQIQGTTEKGLLILHKEDGSTEHFAFKEVEYL